MRKRRRRRMRSKQVVNPFSPAARKFSSPWSQYPSKAGSPILKPEKAPLVQMFPHTFPISSPSLRLSQIRRRKKCTCDDMFSELMHSHPPRTDRAQLNAWRHSVAEARKELSECEEWRQDTMLRLIGEQMDIMNHLLELQESQQEHRPPLNPLYNCMPSSPSSISASPRCPRTRVGRLWAPSHSTPRMAHVTEGCHSNSLIFSVAT
ncbi:uncharacterized protein LOC128840921 [Malaclemys terrapin pileata]|uniref:uncharacterized protein LOC128840921 n=1 Tax=Malaclemys terrapin pileata TaxID=2991368 RepID=UPI0023A7B457|nr:uncharacterized protein LOC128840921 [Malaclemys terrapin pileata]